MLRQMAYFSLLFKMQTQLLRAFVSEWTRIFLVYPILSLAMETGECYSGVGETLAECPQLSGHGAISRISSCPQ